MKIQITRWRFHEHGTLNPALASGAVAIRNAIPKTHICMQAAVRQLQK
jgi:hypothetical protein